MKLLSVVAMFLLCAASAMADDRASVARSFSGGSAAADKIELAQTQKKATKMAEDARAMAKIEVKKDKQTVRRSFSGGSAAADLIEIPAKK